MGCLMTDKLLKVLLTGRQLNSIPKKATKVRGQRHLCLGSGRLSGVTGKTTG